jgi:pyridoxal phosphate enzyme (YggS family)
MNSHFAQIAKSVERILATIPENVTLLAAAKTRSLEEVEAVISAGVTHIGYNYVQEALPIIQAIGHRATWHLIGHLQSNKSRLGVHFFDRIQTVDSWRIARIVDRHCADVGKIMPVLVEVNSGREPNKTGVMPENIDALVQQMSALEHIHVEGLMTMGPRFGDPQDSRPYFIATRQAFERITAMNLPNVSMQYLSMGMSNSYRIAIEEGANMIRIGTKLFGAR